MMKGSLLLILPLPLCALLPFYHRVLSSNHLLPIVKPPIRHRQSHLYMNWKSVDDDETAVIVQPTKNELPPQEDTAPVAAPDIRVGPLGSLELLAALVSLFFVATVWGAGSALFAPPSTVSPPVVNAQQVLQQDFVRNENSVAFSGQ